MGSPRVKPSVGSSLPYLRCDSGKWTRSTMPSDVADELLRRYEWEDCGTELRSHGMAINKSFLDICDGPTDA